MVVKEIVLLFLLWRVYGNVFICFFLFGFREELGYFRKKFVYLGYLLYLVIKLILVSGWLLFLYFCKIIGRGC